MFENIITYMLISIAREKLCGKVLLCFKKAKMVYKSMKMSYGKRRLFLEYDYFFKYNLHVKCEQNAKIPAQKIMW